VVPRKRGNLTEGTLWREGASGAEELLEGKMMGTLSLSNNISTRQEKIAYKKKEKNCNYKKEIKKYKRIQGGKQKERKR